MAIAAATPPRVFRYSQITCTARKLWTRHLSRFPRRIYRAPHHHSAKVLSKQPESSELDDQAFEPGALYLNNELLSELCRMRDDWCLLDVHSGVYMLGTRHPQSANW